MAKDKWEEYGLTATATWIPATEYDGERPLVQAYGVCLAGGVACVLRSPQTGHTMMPGGTVEQGEDIVETLHREVAEEADLTVDEPELLGVQRIEYSDVHPDYETETVYQARLVAHVERAGFITEDPSEGFKFERCFVPVSELNEALDWGAIGDELVRLAKQRV